MKLKFVPFLFISLLLLQGCTALGLQSADTLEQKWSYAVAQTTALRDAATSSLAAKQIGSADAEFVLRLSDNARTFLDAAQVAINAGDVTTAEGRIALAASVLAELQQYLRTRTPK